MILAIFLLPLNWFLESIKWKVILSNLEKISTFTAFKSVLSGITVGFFTPNRIGEYPGRVVYISNKNKVPSIALGFVGSLAQTLVILICGLPSAFIFFTHEKEFELLVGKTLWVFFFFRYTSSLCLFFATNRIKILFKNCYQTKKNRRDITNY
ncbi:MAG: flippase-like domain-containing protein [Bacteroidales bacterium]|nr:flippase-like domain-containing protein [Bacteroidales bacterium]